MNDSQKTPSCDVEALLKELETQEVPEMTPEFDARAMDRIIQRKKELDEEEPEIRTGKSSGMGWRAWVAVAATFVFLLGGTLLTRESFHTEKVLNPLTGEEILIKRLPGAAGDPAGTRNGITLFFQDMWLFVKAALPYLAGAAIVAVIWYFVRKKLKKRNNK